MIALEILGGIIIAGLIARGVMSALEWASKQEKRKGK